MARFAIKDLKIVDDNRNVYIEPVTVDEAKLSIQVEGTAYDAEFQSMITAARQMIEQYLKISLVPKEIRVWVRNPNYKDFPLPFGPIEDFVSFAFMKCLSTSVALTLDATTDGFFQTDDNRVAVPNYACTGINQSFRINYLTTADEREVFKRAIKAQVGYMYFNRDADKRNELAPETLGLIRAFRKVEFIV